MTVPYCKTCELQPLVREHYSGFAHLVQAHKCAMDALGYCPCAEALAKLRKAIPELLKYGPVSASLMRMTEGFWAPTWAVHVAGTKDFAGDWRVVLIRHLAAHDEERQVYESLRILSERAAVDFLRTLV